MSLRASFASALFIGWLLVSGGCGRENAASRTSAPNTDVAPQTAVAGNGSAGHKADPKGSSSGSRGKSGSTVASGDADAGTEPELLPDGQDCSSNQECESGHCNNALCCSAGDCCKRTKDCPGSSDGMGTLCDSPATCQGSHGKLACVEFRCTVENGTYDDSQCGQEIEADDCGPYTAVHCTGDSNQKVPECAESCDADDACDANARCIAGECVADTTSTARCTTDAMCSSGQTCENGRCAGAGGTAAAASPSCLAKLGDDRCSECACSKCERTATACWDGGDPRRDALCSAVLECALSSACINTADCESAAADSGGAGGSGAGGMGSMPDSTYGCFGRGCYCAIGDDLCAIPTGACQREIEAAAGGRTVRTPIASALVDPAYALFDAERHAQCLQRSCRTECGL